LNTSEGNAYHFSVEMVETRVSWNMTELLVEGAEVPECYLEQRPPIHSIRLWKKQEINSLSDQ
jgi:hypothetical protein